MFLYPQSELNNLLAMLDTISCDNEIDRKHKKVLTAKSCHYSKYEIIFGLLTSSGASPIETTSSLELYAEQ